MSKFNDCHKYLPLSPNYFETDNYEKAIDFINSQNLDVVIVGSDAIWNDYQTSIPNVYYLNENVKSFKMSYAASSYGMQHKTKADWERDYVAKALKSYTFIGVRDEETNTYVKNICPDINTEHTCDPSILLDLDKLPIQANQIKEKLEKAGVDFSKPLVGVMGNAQVGKIARETCKDEYALISLYYDNKYCDYSLIDLNPFEWAIVFSFFKATFTSFFHGTIFSLKNGTPTITLEQNVEYSKEYVTKTQDLLNRLGLEDYYFGADKQNIKDLNEQFSKYIKENQSQRIKDALNKEALTADGFFKCLSNIVKE